MRSFNATLFTLILATCGLGCYREKFIRAEKGGQGCRVHLETTSLASPERAKQALERLEQNRPTECGDADIAVSFHLETCGRYPYLSIRHDGSKDLDLWFEGKFVPQNRWSESESWSDAYCGKKAEGIDLRCTSRVTSSGGVMSDPIWGSQSMMGTGCRP